MSFASLQLAANTMFNNQKSLEIVGQNIANAQVEGYSRQQAVQTIYAYGQSIEPPQNGVLSVSAQITQIKRFRNELMDANFRSERMVEGQVARLSEFLQEASQVLGDSSDFSLSDNLNQFWQAWNLASQEPGDAALRNSILQKGEVLALSFRMKAHKLNEISTRVDTEIDITIGRINAITRELATINGDIIPSTQSNYQNNLLMDRRDNLIDELSGLIDIKVVGDVRNSVQIYFDGAPIVSGKNSYPLTLQKNPDNSLQIFSSTGREVKAVKGELAGLMEFRNVYLTEYLDELDITAMALKDGVNDIHRSGYGIDGSTGMDFFTGSSAVDMAVSPMNFEQVALSVPKMESVSNINNDGTTISAAVDIASQEDRFRVTPDASGTIDINGTEVAWTNGDTLQDILLRIQQDTGMNASFDAVSQKVLFSTPPGSSIITITDVDGNFTQFTDTATAVTTGGEPGDGQNGIRMFDLYQTALIGSPPNITINDSYHNLSTNAGFRAQTYISARSIQKEYMQALDARRQAESGVSINEELIDLIKYQRGFQAGARLASTMDELLQTLIRM